MTIVYSHPNIAPYTGFIYLWRNNKENKYYLGSHQGHKDDNYKGSGIYFRKALSKSPKDFTRKIIQFVLGSLEDIKQAELKWLNLIKDSELGTKYYNLTKDSLGLGKASITTKLKISLAKRGISNHTEEWKQELSRRMLGNKLKLGTTISEEHKEAIRKASKPHTEESKERIRQANLGKKYDDELRKKCGNGNRGKSWFTNGMESGFFFPNEQPLGWNLGRHK